jgi:phosphotriesterase-related protein
MVNTVLGPIRPEALGLTLMHEHPMIAWWGWQLDPAAPVIPRKEAVKVCVDRMEELKAFGMRSLLDPCPMDLGRDVEFLAEVSQASGVHIICATGVYKESLGGSAYFRFRAEFGDAVIDEMAETFARELTDGIGSTGIKAGIVKVATQAHKISHYEEMALRAAARAAKATGARITTHTDEGTMGREQLDILASEGVDLRRVIIGHSCRSADLRYHTDMLDRGCSLGFDQLGVEITQPDRLRKAALIGLLGIGFEKQLVLSHDTVWCSPGRPLPFPVDLMPNWHPTHVFKNIIPSLHEAGVPQAKIDTMLIGNPKDFFTD